ncbi:uncharacterized protein LOC117654275 isoform X2 [Thrips palmi]|uniref:Uncharacterized protein LOC117654275 isoform X2 n=1 Tax=Thrips palmi TaxID=161013 RepID=A0A6P9AEC8_THRPL|nr:uncharacterized protein LOC117654275 isoform X2 [Thrips palmi]
MILVAGLMPRMKDYVRRESDVSGILNQPLWSNMDVERRQDLIAQSHDEMAFWTLPDDFLLAVLGHLPTRELFTARLVCRRFRDLCLHRQLWKTRSLANDLFGSDFINLVQRLSSLGGLTELGFCLALENPNSLLVQALLKTIYTISGLQSLFIGGEIPLAADISVDVKVEPSLKKINYRSLGDDACERVPFIGSLLKAHASTLEEVIVELHDVPLSPLQGSKKLRSLTIFPHEELPLLVDCPNLSTIEIVYSDRWVYPAGTIEFFRRAVSLRSVTFTCPVRDSLAPLVALAGSKAAKRVWMLDIFATSPDVITLLGISLYKFPSLRRLTFQGKVTDDFLRAVDPAATPNLTSLALDVCHDGSPCAHSWLHGPAIQDLFARNPRLGLHIENWYGKYGRDCSCRWCSWGCHSKLVEPKGGFSADYI